MCNLCSRTDVTHVSGPYTKGRISVRSTFNRVLCTRGFAGSPFALSG